MDLMNKEGFKKVKWKEVVMGQKVFLQGTHLGKFRAYGPHVVVSSEARLLRNKQGRSFMHFSEELLIEVPT
jgi:hypothetical protein